MNSRFKRTFHNNTQKGGGPGGSSKLAQVIFTMARSMLWRYGFLDGLFKNLGHTNGIDIKFGDVKRIPMIQDDTNAETKAFTNTILRFGTFADLFVTIKLGTVLSVVREYNEVEDKDELCDNI